MEASRESDPKHCRRRSAAAAVGGPTTCHGIPYFEPKARRRPSPGAAEVYAHKPAHSRAAPDATWQLRKHRTEGGNRPPLLRAATRYPAAPTAFARIAGARTSSLAAHPSPGPVYAHKPASPMPSGNPTIRANRGPEPPFLAAHPSPQPFMRINLSAKWLTRIFGTTISLKYKYRAVEFQRPKTGVKIGRGNHCSHSTKRRCREEHDCHASRRGIP